MRRLLVDLSSVIWTSLLSGKDHEHGKYIKSPTTGRDILVNSGGFGYEHAVNHLVCVLDDLKFQPTEMILVAEGMNSKAERRTIYKDYKSRSDHLPEQYEQFDICKQMVIDAFLNVGAQLVWQDGGVEADDVIAYLAKHLKGEVWIDSVDKDMAVLVDDRVHHYRSGAVDANPFGPFPHKYITTWIALVGDSTDGIPGAKGFGPKAAEKLLYTFGVDGLELLEDLIKSRKLRMLSEDVGEMKELERIIVDQANVYTSYELARLRVERVNILHRPLQWRVGMVKPRSTCSDTRLQKWAGAVRLIDTSNYDQAVTWARGQIAQSPFVTLDVETATPAASDEWLAKLDKEDRVDVFGSDLTSVQLTFGPNMQYSVYLPYNNVETNDVKNLTIDQIVGFVDLVPREKFTVVHNAAFELPVCYMAWDGRWKDDPIHHGFLRNVIDSSIMSSYVDENRSRGLKDLSANLLNYEQTTYDELTIRTVAKGEWNGVGQVIEETDTTVTIRLKTNQLTAAEVLAYGADDCICTAALANHFMTVMEIENTWDVFMEVEQWPAYLTALAFVQGTRFSLERMAEIEREDDKAYDEAWPALRNYLFKVGFEGTVQPEMLSDEQISSMIGHHEACGEGEFVLPSHILRFDPAGIKRAYEIIVGEELSTQVRKPEKLAMLIEPEHPLLAKAVAEQDLETINSLLKEHFTGEPVLDLDSPKQMKALLYDHMRIPPKVIGKVTALERQKNPALAKAVAKFKKIQLGSTSETLTEEDWKLIRLKAKSDDTAIDFALAFDKDSIEPDAQAALRAIETMKKVGTRRKLFYRTYWNILHWKDNLIHAGINQCSAVTRRYTASLPNLQQLPKKGEGVKFRGCFLPHHKDAVIASIDYAGQELRLAAERSQDPNMLACYVGDKLKDIHSITAAGALRLKWGDEEVDALFAEFGADLPRDAEGHYDLFLRLREMGKKHPIGKKADDLRKDAKNVNFGAQNLAQALRLSETLVMPVADAELFLGARAKMFPLVDQAAERAADEAMQTGLAFTMMGARRHLRESVTSNDKWEAERAARQAWNMELQGSAAEMTKLGMARLWLSGVFFRYDARFIAPIHDELVSSVHRDHAVDFLREKHAAMTGPYAQMKVPILGSISVGPDFAAQTECGEHFIQENIEQALNDIFNLKEAA